MLFLWIVAASSLSLAAATTTVITRKKDDGSSDDNASAGREVIQTAAGVADNDGHTNPSVPLIHPHPNDPSLRLYHYSRIASTQDEAKRIITQLGTSSSTTDKDDEPFESFCVTTREQTNGRGTSGRKWMTSGGGGNGNGGDGVDDGDGSDTNDNNAGIGNTFVTIGIPMSEWISTQIPLTLLPLKMGCLVANQLRILLDKYQRNDSIKDQNPRSSSVVSVKWPNDILINEHKISGMLIETHDDWFLIGIGVNLKSAPTVPESGPNHGRAATCLRDQVVAAAVEGGGDSDVDWEHEARQLGVDLAWELHQFLHFRQHTQAISNDSSNGIIKEWKSWVDWDVELVMRDTADRERVRLKDVLSDGRVRVVGLEDGVERTLVSDYFF